MRKSVLTIWMFMAVLLLCYSAPAISSAEEAASHGNRPVLDAASADRAGGDAAEVDARRGAAQPEFAQFSDLNGRRVSMLTGAPFEELVRSRIPDVREFTYYYNMPDMLLALRNGKTDAVLNNNAIAALAVNRNPELALFPQDLQGGAFGFAFAKGDPRRDEWQAAFDAIPPSQIQAAWDKWTGVDDSIKVLPEQDWPGLNGTVRVAACDTVEPVSYVGGDGKLKGFDLEVILMAARELDVHVTFTGMEFSAILASVQTGKADIGTGSIIVTPERAEAVDFVEYYPAAFVLVVRSVQTDAGTGAPVMSFADLEHGRIGASTGSIQIMQVEERFPDAELYYFGATVDMLGALRAHKIDAFAEAEPIVRYMMTANPDLTYLDEQLGESMKVGAIFPKTDKGQALCDEFSAFVRDIRQNGVYEELQSIWFGEDEAKRVIPDLYGLPAKNGTLRMAADTTLVPFVFVKDGKPVGLEIDTVVRFCKAYGYGLEVVPMDFSGIIPSVITGKVDFACSGVAYTPERAESVYYSEPTNESGSVIAVLKTEEAAAAAAAEGGSFWTDILSSFEKTFIREGRWRLFADGVLNTLLITALSILFGTLLGFGVFMACRNGNTIANSVTRFSMWLVQGMPMVVLLMILYYIIFGSAAISGIAVAVIGFTVTFGSSVYGLLKVGVGAVDNGQHEAAYALGYTSFRTFFRIILPQALPHVMSAYRGEIVGLIKATSIVGYIAVQDLTKMGDIVRSRTYEAFFPLIAVTVIYFVLEGLIGFLISRVSVSINPKRRRPADVLKGVKTHD